MSNYIKTKYSLADIPNLHQVLIVGERHSDHINTLYALRSLKPMKTSGYGIYAPEIAPDDYDRVLKVNKEILKKGGLMKLNAIDHSFPALKSEAMYWEAESLGYKIALIDLPNKEQKMSRQTVDAKERTIKIGMQDTFSTKVTSLAKKYSMPLPVAAVHMHYAIIGPKTYDNFKEKNAISRLDVGYLKNSASEFRTIYQKINQNSFEGLMHEERDHHMAGEIAKPVLQGSTQKLWTYNGFRHVYNHGNIDAGNRPSAHNNISNVLEEKYSIKSTTVMFVDPNNIKDANAFLKQSHLEKEFLVFEEIEPYSDLMINTNPVEAYFCLNNLSLNERIVDLRDKPVGIDYALVTIEANDNDVKSNIKKKVADQLNLR